MNRIKGLKGAHPLAIYLTICVDHGKAKNSRPSLPWCGAQLLGIENPSDFSLFCLGIEDLKRIMEGGCHRQTKIRDYF